MRRKYAAHVVGAGSSLLEKVTEGAQVHVLLFPVKASI